MVPEKVRNVALVGHGGSGKTSLAEALLYLGGATSRLGSVDQGTSTLDFEPEEQKRRISLGLALASLEWAGHRINLIDTPGYADFAGDARAALRAADLALFAVSAVEGVEVGTETMWRAAEEEGIPRAVVITKLDRERASFERTISTLRDAFGTGIAPIHVPLGIEHDLSGLARVVNRSLYRYEAGAIRGVPLEDTPEAVRESILAAHVAVIESAVEADEVLMERYFEGVEPDREVVVRSVHQGMLRGDIFPVLVASGTRPLGVDILADFLVEYGPSPLERPAPPVLSGSLPLGLSSPLAGFVFKTFTDPFVGKISLFRVYAGSVAQDAVVDVSGRGPARLHTLFRLQGKDHTPVTTLESGDIGAVAKADELTTGSTLRAPGSELVIAPVPYPAPVMEVAITPRGAHDDDKLSVALHRIEDEDPTIRVERRVETGETILAGLGDVHIDVTLERVARKLGVEVTTAVPRVPFRETVTATAEVEGKHKKQSGGRGQFGVAVVRFAPRPRGSGYEFIDSVKGGSVPRQFIPAVDRGIREALGRGILAGYPVVDIAAELLDGKYHPVDSDELSFRMAGIQAVRSAADDLRPVILEPIGRLHVRVPDECTGDIMGDINAKRGRVLGMDTEGSRRVITAEIPVAEIQRYAVDLRSMTSGRGTFEVVFDHYEEMPRSEAEKVVAAAHTS